MGVFSALTATKNTTSHDFPEIDSLFHRARGFTKLLDKSGVVGIEKANTILPPKSNFALDPLTNTKL